MHTLRRVLSAWPGLLAAVLLVLCLFGERVLAQEVNGLLPDADGMSETAEAALAEDGAPMVFYAAYMQGSGWKEAHVQNDYIGMLGTGKRLEAMEVALIHTEKYPDSGIRYRSHIQDVGWEKEWRTDGALSGTVGEGKRLEAIRAELYGSIAEDYDLYYCVYVSKYGWMSWTKNGSPAGTESDKRRIEAIHLRLLPKGAAAPANLGKSVFSHYKDPRGYKLVGTVGPWNYLIYFAGFLVSFLTAALYRRSRKQNLAMAGGVIMAPLSDAYSLGSDGRRDGWKGAAFAVLSSLPLFLIAAFRFDIGTDYDNYFRIFQKIGVGAGSITEVGFRTMNVIVTRITTDPQIFIALLSAVFGLIIYVLIFRRSKNIYLSLLLFFLSYFYFISLNNTRQAIAQAIALIGLFALLDRKYIAYVLLVGVAATVHQAALVYFAFLPAMFIPASSGVLMVISMVWMLIGRTLMPMVMPWIGTFRTQIPMIDKIIRNYIMTGMYMTRTISVTLILFDYLVMGLFVYAENKYRWEVQGSRDWKIAKWNQFFLLMCYGLDGVFPAVYRVARLFSLCQFLLLPNAFSHIRERKIRFLACAFVLAGFLFFFTLNYITGAEGVFPYYSIFSVK